MNDEQLQARAQAAIVAAAAANHLWQLDDKTTSEARTVLATALRQLGVAAGGSAPTWRGARDLIDGVLASQERMVLTRAGRGRARDKLLGFLDAEGATLDDVEVFVYRSPHWRRCEGAQPLATTAGASLVVRMKLSCAADCLFCSGESCAAHGPEGCDCDVIARHPARMKEKQ